MSWSVTTPPTSEPIALADAKLHLRVDSTDDDALITSLIQVAREHVESVCERALMPQTWTERQSTFPDVIKLRGGVVTEVNSVTYVDADGAAQTLDPSAYLADLTTEPATIAPIYGTSWPIVQEQAGAVAVEYAVGYADAASIPAAIKAAMLLIIGNLYANREGAVVGQAINDNPAVRRLLFPYMRVMP